jgi:hypothetical protein
MHKSCNCLNVAEAGDSDQGKSVSRCAAVRCTAASLNANGHNRPAIQAAF